MTERSPDGRTLALAAARAAADKQARDVVVMDVRGPIGITDYFLVCSVSSDRQAKTVGDEVERALREEGSRPLRREGEAASGWMLLDYGDLVVHVFGEEQRKHYDLERLWRDAPLVAWEPSDAATSG
jgi:ribosome-associated protein